MRRMTSKYPSTCRQCHERFPAGTLIDYDRNGARGKKAQHADCEFPGEAVSEHESEFGEYGTTEWNSRPVVEIRTNSGTYYQRAGGRCEDAPCCGCCTF